MKALNLKIQAFFLLVLMLAQWAGSSALVYGNELSNPIAISQSPLFIDIPSRIASVDQSGSIISSPYTFVCIEDSGLQDFRQVNLARALEIVLQQTGAQHVFHEGANGDASLAFLKDMTSKDMRKKVSNNLLHKGYLQGAEYVNLLNDKNFELLGFEDQPLYQETLLSYIELEKKIQNITPFMKQLENGFYSLQRAVYTGQMLRLEETARLFHKNEISAPDYFEVLQDFSQKPFSPIWGFKNLRKLRHLRSEEQNIDWQKLETEYESLSRVLPVENERHDSAASQSPDNYFKVKFSSEDGKLLRFTGLAGKLDGLGNYPEFSKYVSYLKKAFEISREDLLQELEKYEQDVFNSYEPDQAQKRLRAASQTLADLRAFVRLEKTGSEWGDHKRDYKLSKIKEWYLSWKSKSSSYADMPAAFPASFPEAEWQAMIGRLDRFYRLSLKRDQSFYDDTMEYMKKNEIKKGILVLSDYRMRHFKEFFRKKHIPYIVVTPQTSALWKDGVEDALLSQFRETPETKKNGATSDNRLFGAKPALLRPLRSQFIYDIYRGTEPFLWKLSGDLGLSFKQRVDMVLGLVQQDASKMGGDFAARKPEFWWMRKSAQKEIKFLRGPTLKQPLSLQSLRDKKRIEDTKTLLKQTLEKLDDTLEEPKYQAFKNFVNTKDESKLKTVSEQMKDASQKLHSYESSLKQNQNADQKKDKTALRKWLSGFSTPAGIWVRLFGKNLPQVTAEFLEKARQADTALPLEYDTDNSGLPKTLNFLRKNMTHDWLPLSYKVPDGYWDSYSSSMDDLDAVLERLLVQYSTSIYDAALWQIVLASQNDPHTMPLVDAYTHRLLSGSSGLLEDIRAYGPVFKYGDKKKVFDRDHGYFFRIISDRYLQEDPKDNSQSFTGFPNMDRLHHEDWKPITGEQAWAAIIGPLQVAYFKNQGHISYSSNELQLALSILPAVEAMVSPTGGIYHAPEGTHQKQPFDISNENNFSMYAALKMLDQVVKDWAPSTDLKIRAILKSQEAYLKQYAFNVEDGVFYQGGFYAAGEFIPSKIFAVDCQTWGILAMGPAWIDQTFGDGTAFQIWKNTKLRAGYFDTDGRLEGVGFTDGHKMLSVEWTCGSILAASKLAAEYKTSHPDWAREIQLDIVSMRTALEKYKTTLPNGTTAYLYANKRYFIPFGWWANPIPSMASSAWVVMIDTGFNPFILGGGPEFHKTSFLKPSYYSVTVPDNSEKLADEKQALRYSSRLASLRAGDASGEMKPAEEENTNGLQNFMSRASQMLKAPASSGQPAEVSFQEKPLSWWQKLWNWILKMLHKIKTWLADFFHKKEIILSTPVRPAELRSLPVMAPFAAGNRLFQNQIEEEPLPAAAPEESPLRMILAVVLLILSLVTLFFGFKRFKI